jgi:hypothetical protein
VAVVGPVGPREVRGPARIEPEKEKAQFAIHNAAQMLKQLQTDYQAAWYGEIDLDGERKP